MSPALLLAALLLDKALGDPNICWHPVRLMGRLSQGLERLFYPLGRFGGLLHWAFGGFLVVVLTWTAIDALARYAPLSALVAELLLVWLLLAFGDLKKQALAVAVALEQDQLAQARALAGQLVSRDTKNMDPQSTGRAALESLAENFVDGFLSPLLAYWLFGLEGLLLFKWTSTLDSMIGYKTPQYAAFGWTAAKLDDLANWLPARLAWGLIALSAWAPGCSLADALKWGWRHHNRLDSPNSGWPEAAAAGALGIRLGGPVTRSGVLIEAPWLGDPQAELGGEPRHIRSLARLFERLWWALALAVAFNIVLNRYDLVTSFTSGL